MQKVSFDYHARCQRAQENMKVLGVDYLLVGPSADLLYLIGLNRPQSERLTLLLLPQEGTGHLIIPKLDRGLAEPLATFFDIATWEETENVMDLVAALLPNRGKGLRLAVAEKLFSHFLFALMATVPEGQFVSGADIVGPLRLCKEPDEIECLTRVGAAADATFTALLGEPLVGMSEAAIKARLVSLMPQHGHDTAYGAIVGAGANGALPHHHSGDYELQPGDAVVVDFGGHVSGYWSDMTRTFHVGEPTPEFREVYNLVNEANQKAFEAIRPGVEAGDIDKAARDHITAAGYGKFFLHRTGHGLGLDIHEPPYIVGGSKTILEEGMVFSIEPGVYLPGKFGVRIEDIVVVTTDGARRFNLSTHDLQIL